MLDEKTIYNYIDAGLLSVGNIDLPRKVRYRIRKKKKPVRVDKQRHVGRTYDDFQEFIAANPDIAIVEMDSVEGCKGGKVFLTIYFRNCSLMLAFIRYHNTARSVTEVFNRLYELLGHETFTMLFPVILTDYAEFRIRRTGEANLPILYLSSLMPKESAEHMCFTAILSVPIRKAVSRSLMK